VYKVSHGGAFKDLTQIAVSSQSGQVNLVFLLPAKWLFSLIPFCKLRLGISGRQELFSMLDMHGGDDGRVPVWDIRLWSRNIHPDVCRDVDILNLDPTKPMARLARLARRRRHQDKISVSTCVWSSPFLREPGRFSSIQHPHSRLELDFSRVILTVFYGESTANYLIMPA
jgi:hypothetical protein